MRPALVLAAHGSRDPHFAHVVAAVAEQVRRQRRDLDVQVGYLDHGPPLLSELNTAGAVVVPLFLAGGYHVRVDIPTQAPQARVAKAIGPDPLIAGAVRQRLVEAGYVGGPVVLAAAGSSERAALADVDEASRQLARLLSAPVALAFVSTGEPRLADVDTSRVAVASYLLSPGVFADQVRGCGAPVVAAPIGAHPALAAVVLARFDQAYVPGRIAPA